MYFMSRDACFSGIDHENAEGKYFGLISFAAI